MLLTHRDFCVYVWVFGKPQGLNGQSAQHVVHVIIVIMHCNFDAPQRYVKWINKQLFLCIRLDTCMRVCVSAV